MPPVSRLNPMPAATPRTPSRRSRLPGRLPVAWLALPLVGALVACGGAPAVVPSVPEPTYDETGFVRVSTQASEPTRSGIADLVERVTPAVVNITTVQSSEGEEAPFEFFFSPEHGKRPPRQRTGAGSGFIIDPAGFAITNAHVVAGAEEVRVRLWDDRQFEARVIGRDRKLDLALLRLDGAQSLPSVVLGDSDALRVGEQVVAVGNPFGLGSTVTMGIVSAKARTIGAGPYDDFIQTDASINPGNSGGPLFNLRGEVVGINTAIRAGANGIGFAIPIDDLRDVVAQLRTKGFVERGKLGLTFQPVTDAIAAAVGLDRPWGAMVNEVVPDSAAARAGLQSGDVILRVNDADIHRAEDLPRNVARHSPGSEITMVVLRAGQRLTATATLDRLEDEEGPPPARSKPEKVRKEVLMGLELEDTPDGVRIVGMSRPTAGLLLGDLVVEVDRAPVRSVAELQTALANAEKRGTALFRVRRGESERYVGVPIVR